MTSIQNILDRNRVEVVTINRTRSKMPPTGLGAHCSAGRNKTAPQVEGEASPKRKFKA